MEAGYAFMDKILEYPVAECMERLVSLPEVVGTAGVIVEFSRTRIAGKYERLFYLREGLAEDLVAVAAEMNDRGWILKVEDGYRSRAMQKHLALAEYVLDVVVGKVIWETGGKIPTEDLLLRRLTTLVATCPKIGTHMCGTALDISVLRMEDRSEIDRGGPYIELSELTAMGSPFVSSPAARNRSEINQIMQRHGFLYYPYEFWHYSKGDAYAQYLAGTGKPGRYGPVDFDPAEGTISPIESPEVPLHSLDDIKRHLEYVLKRRARKGNFAVEGS